MTVNTLDNLVLRGVSLTGDVNSHGTRIGGYPVHGRSSALVPSLRHLAPGTMPAERFQPVVRVNENDADASAGAGRSHGPSGVLCYRSPASFAGRTSDLRWSSAETSRSTAVKPRALAKAKPFAAKTSPDLGCLAALAISHSHAGQPQCQWPSRQSGTQPASTRGCRS